MPTATLGTAPSQARPTAIVHWPTASSARGTHSVTAGGDSSIRSRTSPRDRSRPTTRATRRWLPAADGSMTIASRASCGTANDVARIQPPSSTTTPVEGPLAGVTSADDASAASETPAVSIRTTDAATRSTAARIAASSANGRSSATAMDAEATAPSTNHGHSQMRCCVIAVIAVIASSPPRAAGRDHTPRSFRCGRPTAAPHPLRRVP